ncbi:MAG TPA: hypothetical protein VGJ71_09305 [Candidatus Limnocylindrales bacterium]|jgi:hypothetical protein
MAFATPFQPAAPRSGVSSPRTAAIAIVAGAAMLVLFLAGISFIGLAIAFPIAVPAAVEMHVPVAAADVEIAKRFAEFSWLFGALGFASLVGAAVVAFKAIGALSREPRD